jgi:hypothetical protein
MMLGAFRHQSKAKTTTSTTTVPRTSSALAYSTFIMPRLLELPFKLIIVIQSLVGLSGRVTAGASGSDLKGSATLPSCFSVYIVVLLPPIQEACWVQRLFHWFLPFLLLLFLLLAARR